MIASVLISVQKMKHIVEVCIKNIPFIFKYIVFPFPHKVFLR